MMTNFNGKAPIYLDYAATTPVDPRVVQKMSECLSLQGVFGNPSSPHHFGIQAKAVVEEAREVVARLVHTVARNIIFTSGATESNNLAIKGIAQFYQNKGKHIVTSKTEHKAVLEPCEYLESVGFEVTYLAPGQDGLISLEALKAVLRSDTILVSLMHVNNETGVVQDIETLGKLLRDAGIFFHVDAAQSVGKLPINLQTMPVDLMSFSAHKLYGPKGIGALYLGDRPRVCLVSQILGGGQERKLRAGTLPTHQIVGMGEAFSIAAAERVPEMQKIKTLCDRFWEGLKYLPQVYLNGHEESRLSGILNIRFQGMEGEVLLKALSGLAISFASACNSINIEPSYVLRAMGLTDEEAHRSLRFSFGRFTTESEIDRAIQCIREVYTP